MSTFEEIHLEFEISPEVKSVDIHAFEGFYPLYYSGVVVDLALSALGGDPDETHRSRTLQRAHTVTKCAPCAVSLGEMKRLC